MKPHSTQQNYALERASVCDLGPQQLLVASPRGGSLVTRPRFAALIRSLVRTGQARFSRKSLQRLCHDHELSFADATDYLCNKLGLMREEPRFLSFSSILLLGDDALLIADAADHFRELSTIPVRTSAPNCGLDSCLFILILTRHDEDVVRSLYESYRATPGAAFTTLYFLSHFAMIDSLYIPGSGSPCHFCQFLDLKEGDARRHKDASASFSRYYEYAVRLKQPEALSLPRTAIEERVALWYLFQAVAPLIVGGSERTMFTEDVACYTQLDFHSGTVKREPSLHWPLCDCLARRDPNFQIEEMF